MYNIAPVFQKTFTSYKMPISFSDILAYNLVIGFSCFMSLNERYLFGYFGEEEDSFNDINAFRFEDFKENYKNIYPNLYDYLEQNRVILKIVYQKPYFQIVVFEEQEKERKEFSFLVYSTKEIFHQLELWRKREKGKEKFKVLRREE